MIIPINGHVLIEPVKRDSFISSQRETFQEIGIVISIAADLTTIEPLGTTNFSMKEIPVKKGDKVLFDAWLGKKFPKEGSDTEYYWLIKYSDIVAYER